MNAITKVIIIGGYGRMGKMLCDLARNESAFELCAVVDRKELLDSASGCECDVMSDAGEAMRTHPEAVAIDFTTPDAAMDTAGLAALLSTPLVIGTTGFSEEQKSKLEEFARVSPVLWSANMSIGVNVLLDLLPRLTKALGPAYDIEIMEMHHRRKKDAPSGTALMLGEAAASSRSWSLGQTRRSCRDGLIGERGDREIGIQALRGGDVVGIHSVYFLGPGEIIEIRHQAETRENFAQGALRAARWLQDQTPGRLYSMQDVIREEIA